jgi:glycosyltransferase involved in cell wall biosynthesis
VAKRLAIVTHNIVRGDGQGRVAMEIARRALRDGWEVTLIADRVEPELLKSGAKLVAIPLGLLSRKVILVKVWEFAARADAYLKKHEDEFDIVLGYGFTLTRPHHVSNAQFCHTAWNACPAYQSMWKGAVEKIYQNLVSRSNSIAEKIVYRRAQVIVSCSNQTGSEIAALGIPEERIKTIYNGADPADFSPEKVVRSTVGLPEGGVLASFIGDIRTGRKGLDTVLHALREVPELRLAVVGSAEESPFPALAKELGVAERVFFLGYRTDVHKILQASDFFVFPSRYEPFGMVALEAAFCGIPSVLARTVGASEAVASAAMVIENPDDRTALAEGMRKLSSDPALRERLGNEGIKLRESLHWDALTSQWMALFDELSGK